MLALEKSAASDSSSPNLWISALRAAAGVARQATANQQDVIHAVTDELSRLQLRGGVSLMTDEGQLLVQSRSLPKKIEDALEVRQSTEIRTRRHHPHRARAFLRVGLYPCLASNPKDTRASTQPNRSPPRCPHQ